MMTQINAPIHSYENDHKSPHPYYQLKIKKTSENLYLANETRYTDWNLDLEPKINHLKKKSYLFILGNSNSKYFLLDCFNMRLAVAVQPNSEKPGSPNSTTNKKKILSSFKYDLLNKHVKSSDQQVEAVHPVLSGAHTVLCGAHTVLSGAHTVLSSVDIKFMKILEFYITLDDRIAIGHSLRPTI